MNDQMPPSMTIRGLGGIGQMPVYDHPHNDTRHNERGVELALAKLFLGSIPDTPTALEVGNVLAHYPDLDELLSQREVLDKYEDHPRVDHPYDLFDPDGLVPSYDLIVSISTLEHIGINDDNGDARWSLRAFDLLRSLLSPGGTIFVTAPYGHNWALDEFLMAEVAAHRAHLYQRQGSEWVSDLDTVPLAYGATQPWAEAVFIGTWRSA